MIFLINGFTMSNSYNVLKELRGFEKNDLLFLGNFMTNKNPNLEYLCKK